MPYDAMCVDAVGVCANALQVRTTGQQVDDCATFQLRSLQPPGDPIDLTDYGISTESEPVVPLCGDVPDPLPDNPTGVHIAIRQTPSARCHYYETWATILTDEEAQDGTIHFLIPAKHTKIPGIWLAQATVYQDGQRKLIYPFFYEIQPSLENVNYGGVLTLPEIRLALRDVCPEANVMLDALEYSDHEIAAMIRDPIDYWNERPPPIAVYTPMNFPFRYHWKRAVVGQLLRMVSYWMLRKHLPYSAGGLTVDDTVRWKDYMKLADQELNDWKEFVRTKKAAINIGRGFGAMGGYPQAGYW